MDNLVPQHIADLESSGISLETAKAEGIFSGDEARIRKILDRSDFKGGGLVYPYQSLNGFSKFYRVKPDNPPLDKKGKAAKYLTKRGAGNRLFIPRGISEADLNNPEISLVITEGEKKAIKAVQEGILCVGVSGVYCYKDKQRPFLEEFNHIPLKGRKICICYDSDAQTNPKVRNAESAFAAVLVSMGAIVEAIRLPSGPDGDKVGLDDFLLNHSTESFWELPTEALDQKLKGLTACGITEFLQKEFPPRENLLDPWLPSQGIAMIHAFRGIGKTHVGLGIAYAIASGGSFLTWSASKPQGVLYLDGEMPANVMQDRLAEIVKATPYEPQAPFKLITPDLQDMGMPDLATKEGQELINQHVTEEIKLIIVDNLSCLVKSGKENEADSWQPIQTWALGLRSRGVSVLFMHHSSKTGGQRGTSRREDVLDAVINLRRPIDYRYEDGAVFEVYFEKARGIYGDDVAPFESILKTDENGNHTWLTRSLEDTTFDKVVKLTNEGLSQKEIAIELNLHKSNVSRHHRRATEEGLIKPKGSQ